MSLNDREKEKIIDSLEKLSDAAREVVLVSLEAFAKWLVSALPSIYSKVKDALRSLWESLISKF